MSSEAKIKMLELHLNDTRSTYFRILFVIDICYKIISE